MQPLMVEQPASPPTRSILKTFLLSALALFGAVCLMQSGAVGSLATHAQTGDENQVDVQGLEVAVDAMLDGEVTLTAPDAAALRAALQTMHEVLSSPEELQQRMRSSETVQKLAERVPQVAELLAEPAAARAAQVAELQAALMQMAAVLQDPEASAKALEQVTLARAQLAALGPKKLAALAKEFPELPALGFIAQGVPETDGEEPATPRFLSSLMELFNPAQAFQVARPPAARAPAAQMGARKPVAKKGKGKGERNYKAISLGGKSQFIDVSGGSYQEVDTFVPQFDEIGVLPPIGRWDPLKIREQGPERYRRFVEMEIKHGRLAMAGFLGAITTYSGIRWPGYLSVEKNILFTDMPGGPLASWAALPTTAWFQIVLFISFLEIYYFKQDPNKDAGDVVPEGIPWARYPDGYDVWLGDGSTKQVGEEELFLGKTWKLNAERNNGRAAMMGMTGMLIHEALTGNPVFPIGEQL